MLIVAWRTLVWRNSRLGVKFMWWRGFIRKDGDRGQGSTVHFCYAYNRQLTVVGETPKQGAETKYLRRIEADLKEVNSLHIADFRPQSAHILELILQQSSVQIDLVTDANYRTPLGATIADGNEEAVEELLAARSNSNQHWNAQQDSTSSYSGKRFHRENGPSPDSAADVNTKTTLNMKTRAALDTVVESWRSGSIELLIKNGAVVSLLTPLN
jgi:ankyrin repeat protein